MSYVANEQFAQLMQRIDALEKHFHEVGSRIDRLQADIEQIHHDLGRVWLVSPDTHMRYRHGSYLPEGH